MVIYIIVDLNVLTNLVNTACVGKSLPLNIETSQCVLESGLWNQLALNIHIKYEICRYI